MRKLLVAGVAALAVLVPVQASALMFLGARVGYALPSGDVSKGQALRDNVSGNVPIQVDAGVSALGILSLGIYGSYAPTRIADDLKSSPLCAGVSCSGQNLRAGIQVNLRPPVVMNSLWGGVFGGVEQQQLKLATGDAKFRGWEAGLQAGWDFSVLPLVKMGPYASYSIGQFTSQSGGDIGTKAQHTSLTFGLRGLFDF